MQSPRSLIRTGEQFRVFRAELTANDSFFKDVMHHDNGRSKANADSLSQPSPNRLIRRPEIACACDGVAVPPQRCGAASGVLVGAVCLQASLVVAVQPY